MTTEGIIGATHFKVMQNSQGEITKVLKAKDDIFISESQKW